MNSSSSKAFTPLSKLPLFDPRSVPVMGEGDPLPPIDPPRLSEAFLRRRFIEPPVWQPEVLAESRFSGGAPIAASVLIAIVQRARPTVLLTQRSANLSNHSGQIAFPGGKRDPDDADVRATALREAREEISLQPGFVEILGELPLYVTGTGFSIAPVVALVHQGFALAPNPGEVDAVFEVPLEFLMNPINHRRHLFESAEGRREWLSMPYRDGETERFIWGATAGILRNFYRFLSA
ncbi:MAG: CoA pyrophosphatase [Burkholderiaceae bacterium]